MSRKSAIEAELCRRSGPDFAARMWPVVERTRPLQPSIALDAFIAAGAAVAQGRIKRLAVACPPGVAKSLWWSVLFPAWLLLRSGGTSRAMTGSYAHSLAERDSRRTRDLVQSAEYRALVGGRWAIRDDAASVSDWQTTSGGRRLVTSTGSKALGERATVQILDDVLSGADIHSDSARKEAKRWVSEVMPSRLEDADNDPRVMIGQRLHVDDPIGLAIEQGWTLLRLPAVLAAGDAPCELYDDAGALVWRDPRQPGQPLVSLLGPTALERLKVELGSTAFAAQYGQSPSDDSSARIRRSWWRFHRPEHVPANAPRPAGCDVTFPAVETPTCSAIAIGCDLTFGATSSTADYAVAAVWGAHGGGRYLLDMWRARAGFEAQLDAIQVLAKRYPGAAVIVERAANGAAITEQLRKVCSRVLSVKPIGSKLARMAAMTPAAESGALYLPLGASWLSDAVEEFAGAAHDDIPDASAYSLAHLDRSGTTPESGCSDGGDANDWREHVTLDATDPEAAILKALGAA